MRGSRAILLYTAPIYVYGLNELCRSVFMCVYMCVLLCVCVYVHVEV